MIKALLSILVLGKFAEAAGFNFHNSFGDSDDIEGGSFGEAMNYEGLDIPSDETNNNFIGRLFNYATSGIYRLASAFEEFNGTSSEIPESNRAEAAPWADQLESKTIKLASGQIPVTEALTLLPQLLMHFNVIESANTIIKTNEIIIAALKMRSIIPDYIIDEEDPDEKEFKRLIGPLSFNRFQAAFSEIKFIKPYLQLALKSKKKNVPTYYTLLSNHLENLLFRLGMNQISPLLMKSKTLISTGQSQLLKLSLKRNPKWLKLWLIHSNPSVKLKPFSAQIRKLLLMLSLQVPSL